MRSSYVNLFDIGILHILFIALHFTQEENAMSNPTKMPLALFMSIAVILLFGNCEAATNHAATGTLSEKIRIVSNAGEVVIVLYDNPMSRDFASLLPLSLLFRDYVGEEKIADLSRKLAMAGGLTANDVQGDFAYYAPWGNLAVFYKGFGKGSGLYILGRIESGKEWLAGQQNDFTARIEVVEQSAQTEQQ